ncbi:YibE F family protein [Agrilactobacillus composti DSM 18527 = JCM 14202]|uniref:YibE F family protein n=1 Tax=Agrilactobacillus composti DSM 18527 = JCM 14202 TaxID=1423734 RepID=A0A0R1Y4Z1_9LACO|nr:YibE/F family protein [Agrilactobacillus composti]KRM35129.1 YibE F family protein [Agrilactobacillus composti DSM 18527 = JCM 14202]
MGVITSLALVLLVLLILVTGKDTFSIFGGLILNFILIFMVIILISLGTSPLLTAFIFGLIILALIIFFSPVDLKTGLVAYLVSVSVVLVLVALVVPIQHFGQLQGFGNESNEELGGFSLLIGISFQSISSAAILLSALGAIAEASIAMASALKELIEQTPDLDRRDLYRDGVEIGGKIMGTAYNTLFFGFFGGYLALFIWFIELKYSPSLLINDKLFIAEAASVLVSMIAVTLTVPLTTFLMVHWQQKFQISSK